MTVPAEVARLLVGRPVIGVREQAFIFMTVDDAGFPHTALLSRSELGVSPSCELILAAVMSPRTRANLQSRRLAGLVAVAGATAHHVRLRVVWTAETEGALGCVLRVVGHKADSLGIPLAPISFVPTPELARLESWDTSEQVLNNLSGMAG